MSGSELSRRGFLVGSAGTFGLLAGLPAARGTPPSGRPLLTGPFPRAFVFRQCEVLAQLRDYATWSAPFAAFGGIMGKALPEERTDTVTSRNLSYFRRFKRDHPETVLLLHYNGRARLPNYRTSSWYAGDWLHYAGATVTEAVDATDTELTVDPISRFRLTKDAFGSVAGHLVLTARTVDGDPDWSQAEQLVLTAIDATNNTLTVERGRYASQPLTLPADGYVAQHVTVGPWSAQDDRLWAYNLAVDAPRASDGLNAADRICAEMAADFGHGGQLARFDGLELDVFQFPVLRTARDDVDGDGDGKPDGCFSGETDTYLAGQADLLTGLRVAIGRTRILVTDGGGGQRPVTTAANGIELEEFATQDTPRLAQWSSDIGALSSWERVGRRPAFTYPIAKTGTGVCDPPDFPDVRVSIAAALLTGCQLTFWDEPAGSSLNGLRTPPDSGVFVDRFSVWDELVGGTAGDPGWLGQALDDPVWIALSGADLLRGAGTVMRPSWVAGLVVTGATATRVSGPALRLDPSGPDEVTLTFVVSDFVGGDLVFSADLRTGPSPGVPPSVPRLVDVTIRSGSIRRTSHHYVTGAFHPVRAYARDLPAGDVQVQLTLPAGAAWLRGVRIFAGADAGYRLFEQGAVFANPSLHPYHFDLTGLGSFVRLTASAGQDPTVNDGSPLAAAVTIPPCDALLVHRVAQ